jgi:hypothetical protein
MTPEERQMISDLFGRIGSTGVDKDREAEALITQQMRRSPDAAYMLVQSVLMQDIALQQSTARIEDLEEQLRQIETSNAPQRSSGSFLGGLFGGAPARPSAPSSRSSSVPAFGSRPAASTPWGSQPAPGYGSGPRDTPAAPMGGQPPPAASPGGGFLKGAMATVAGVAGGMLLAESVRNMLGGSSANASTSSGQGGYEDNDPASGSHGSDNSGSYIDNDPGAGWDSGSDGNDIDL